MSATDYDDARRAQADALAQEEPSIGPIAVGRTRVIVSRSWFDAARSALLGINLGCPFCGSENWKFFDKPDAIRGRFGCLDCGLWDGPAVSAEGSTEARNG